MQCTFPYFENRPHVPIHLEYKGRKVRFLPLLDSGADFSIFYQQHALELDLNWNEGEKVKLINADGSEFVARQFMLPISLEDVGFIARICFVKHVFKFIPTIGRRDIFHQFRITIDEAVQQVTFSGR